MNEGMPQQNQVPLEENPLPEGTRNELKAELKRLVELLEEGLK